MSNSQKGAEALIPFEFQDTGRGMQALRDIKPHQNIICIPKSELILPEIPELSQQASLAVQLLRLKSKCPFDPYINILPSHYDFMPMQMCTEIQSLMPFSITRLLEKQLEIFDQDYTSCRVFLQNDLSRQDYAWAWLTVNTRCITINTHGARLNMALAPYLDLLNHSSTQADITICQSASAFAIKTNQFIPKGSQVFISYGPHDNAFLLTEYGFIEKDNPYKYVYIPLERYLHLFSVSKDQYPQVNALIKQHGLLDVYLDDSEPSYTLLNALRLWIVFESECTEMNSWIQVQNGVLEIVSLENEKRVKQVLRVIIQDVKMKLQESLEKLYNFDCGSLKEYIEYELDMIEKID